MKSFLVLLALISLAGPGLPTRQGAPQPVDELQPMPALTLHDFAGKRMPVDAYKDTILVIDFWATWCGPCIAEVPALNRLDEKYSARGVKVIGVTMASGEAKEVKPFIDRFKIKYTVLMGDDNQAYDFNIIGFPTTYLVTRDRKVYRKFIGVTPGKSQQLEAEIQKLLQSNAG
ncbi:MAG TPA: TlpA disulfide reductase family protein [Blastocatellia bacterium]|nr:TlpA disulfide reductase family protein [Blastocatellia bacterium]